MDNQDINQTIEHVIQGLETPVEDVEVLTPAIVAMTARGVSPEAVAALLGISASSVRRVTVTTKSWLGDDDAMADNMRHLLTLAYGNALEVFEFGPQSEKATLTRLLIAYALKSISGESTSQFDEIRGEFDDMLGRMRRQDVNHGSGIGPLAINALNTDEGFDD
jgi:hypothetical protein